MRAIESEVSATGQLDVPANLIAVVPVGGGQRWIARHWWVAFSASAVFVVTGHLLIKAGLNAAVASSSHVAAWMRLIQSVLQPEVVAGLLIYFLGSVCWMIAVAQKEISFLYPLSSVNYVLVVIISYLWFAEAVSLQRASGVAFIVLGMVLLNRHPSRTAI
jgi:uncharacterized membrane protein